MQFLSQHSLHSIPKQQNCEKQNTGTANHLVLWWPKQKCQANCFSISKCLCLSLGSASHAESKFCPLVASVMNLPELIFFFSFNSQKDRIHPIYALRAAGSALHPRLSPCISAKACWLRSIAAVPHPNRLFMVGLENNSVLILQGFVLVELVLHKAKNFNQGATGVIA